MAPRAAAGWWGFNFANGVCWDRVVGMMWGFLLLWLFYPRYDQAGVKGKIGSIAASLELVQAAAPSMLQPPIWHQSFLQTMRLGLPSGARGAQRSSPGPWEGRDGAEPPPGLSSSLAALLSRLWPQGCPQALPAASPHLLFFLSLWFFFLFLKLLCGFPFRSRVIIFG